jgi:crossover junction endodeoxyribonuclease RuvC
MVTSNVIIACDPGIEGAFAVMVDGTLAEIEDMPTMTRLVSGNERRYVAPDIVDGLLRSLLVSYVGPADMVTFVIEEVGFMPKKSGSGMFAFGRGTGHVEGIVIGLRIPRINVEPAKWKRELRMKRGKDASRQRAMELFPTHRELFARVKDDGRAEAALIAKWAHDIHGIKRAHDIHGIGEPR